MTTTTTPKKLLTPAGLLDWPYLTKADTGYHAEGMYHTKIIFADSPEFQKFFKAVSDAHQEAYDKATAEAKAGKRIKLADMPVYEQGGQFIMKAKLKAAGVRRDNGEGFIQAPRIFDSKNAPWDLSVAVYTGTIARLAVELVPFNSPTAGAGISLRLKDVQVVRLAEKTVASPFGGPAAVKIPVETFEEVNPFADAPLPVAPNGAADF